MTRKWLGSADVDIQDGALSVAETASSLAGGTKIVAKTNVPEPLVAIPTPCRKVWIGARISDAAAALNTKPCFIGDATNQNIPIVPGNAEGLAIPIDDASKVYIKAGANGEGVVYRIFA